MSSDVALLVLCLVGVLQGFMLAIAVASLRGGLRWSNRLLAAILFGSAAVMVVILATHRSPTSSGPLEWLEYLTWLAAGPLFYLYARLVVDRDRWPSPAFALHFLPAALWATYLAGWWWLGRVADASAWPWRPPVVGMIGLQLAYTALAFRRWWAARDLSARGTVRGPHDYWLPAALVVLAILHVAQWTRWVFRDVPWLTDIVPLAGSASFVVLSMIGLRRAIPLLRPEPRRYATSSLSAERAGAIADRLEQHMASERPHLRADLTLNGLAGELEVPKTHLSQVLNERFGQSFLEFVSTRRIRESERLLLDPELGHLTIEALAHRSGFRSRSAFYEAFRRHNGTTPSEYRRRATSREAPTESPRESPIDGRPPCPDGSSQTTRV